MTGEPILIAGLSGRSLAASARRAGFVPLVVDCFGDEDTQELTGGALHVMPKAFRFGFKSGSLIAALDGLQTRCGAKPIGVLLGSGFEDSPDVIADISKRFPVLGCDAATVRAVKNPSYFFSALRSLGITHPETRREPPAVGDAVWFSKRIGGSGGTHIKRLDRDAPVTTARHYYQAKAKGRALSVTALMTDAGPAVAFTQSWLSQTEDLPCRYGGTVGAIDVEPELEAYLVDTVLAVTRQLEEDGYALRGLVSFDFMVDEDVALLLEINPRPTASLDVLDDAAGTLMTTHILAATGGDALDHLAQSWQPATSAVGYLYADKGDLRVSKVDWPDWCADRPPVATIIPQHGPVASVIARAPSVEAAQQSCIERLGFLEDMLYGAKTNN